MPEILLKGQAVFPKSQCGLVYFVCGNPGLIEYYDTFLGCLSSFISHLPYEVFGRNLLGFADEDHELFSATNLPYDLEDQIEGVMRDVEERGKGYKFVVLMGHSVGAYISVEVMRRLQQKPGNVVNIRHGLLLFPTLEWISKSSAGRRMGVLQRIPGLNANAHSIAAMILSLFSYGMLLWIMRNIMGFDERCAGITARWLKSKGGVYQGIHLGKSEMDTICEGKWEEDLWGLVKNEHGGMEVPRFFIYYGKQDHWVDNHVRDLFIERRKQGTRVEVDGGDVRHAFCLKDDMSLIVAKRVARWIEEIAMGG